MEKFISEIKLLAKRVENIKDNIFTEEATKTSIIMPFFQNLGYDIFNPSEFTPEFIADVGIKKGEKVDYAIMDDGNPVILIEAKSISEHLHKHDSQLFRYFGTTTAKFGILTNGIIYRFYTDLEEQNKMDDTPFFEFNLLELKETSLQELYKFHKESFDLENIFTTASELKYLNKLKSYLSSELEFPSESFVKYLVSQVYDGVKTKNTIDRFEPIIKKAFKQFINEQVNEKLNAALKSTNDSIENAPPVVPSKEEIHPSNEPVIVTTEDEIQGYTMVKIILKDVINPERVFYKDNQSYLNVLIDNNIRKWVVRLSLEKNKKTMTLNDEYKTKLQLENLTDIMNYSEKIIDIAKGYV
ncbi:type I restriction endonuclease [Paenisporosarcina cavernae]|uniref:Endonuclease n=1 Tax=Paenisporosarcina cavernae TaxID=2320858 RepID=A0A385YXZ3_9BACL|nr:type I restriction endonuclease [Paenisporosarcina cavernae]AYC30478.1 endonuclease [Paenisporosarcina cavernae]